MKKILFGLILGLLLGASLTFYFLSPQEKQKVSEYVMCTEEAKVCPDGSSVGRTGPLCEFAQCPGSGPRSMSTSSNANSNHAGQQLVYFRGVTRDGLSATVEVDPIEMFGAEEARKAAIQDTGCDEGMVVICAPSLNNSFYIRNSSTSTEKYVLTLSTDVYLISTTDAPNIEKVGVLELKEKYDAGLFSRFVDQPFWIVVKDGKIAKIEQQYLP